MVYAYIIADSDMKADEVSKIVYDTVHAKFKGADMKECTFWGNTNKFSSRYKVAYHTQNDNKFNEWMFHGFRSELDAKYANKLDVEEVGILHKR